MSGSPAPAGRRGRGSTGPPGSACARCSEACGRLPGPRCPRRVAGPISCSSPLRPLRLLVGRMAMEGAGRRELAELMADHVLVDHHRQELVAVVDAEGQADELRQDRRAPRPHLDDLVAAAAARGLRLLQQIAIDERALPNRAGHVVALSFAYLPTRRRRRIMPSVFLLRRVLVPLVPLPQGVTGWRPPEVRPSPPPWGWSIGFIATPRTDGRLPSQRLRPALPMLMFCWSGLDTAPIVAMHSLRTMRTSPEPSRSSA